MTTATKRVTKTGNARLWVIVGGAGPGRIPQYVEYGRPGAVRWGRNEGTAIEVPDGDRYDSFIEIDEVAGAEQKPTLGWTNRMILGEVSIFRALRDLDCPADVQVHYGVCENPRDFNGGYQMVHILEQARTDYNTDELGALQSSERAAVNENGTFTGARWIDVIPVTFAEQNASGVTAELVDVAICDSASCQGECGAGSDGCQRVFALMNDGTVKWTDDGGATWASDAIDGISTDLPTAIACVGVNLVVTTAAGENLYWAPIADVVSGASTWQEVGGYTASKGPVDLFSLGSSLTWIVGLGGYIYFADDITAAPEIQDSGAATAQNLNAIHGIDARNLVAVGASNAVVYTTNGGESWASRTGPVVGQALNTVWMRTKQEWLVGVANGELWHTDDTGLTWTEISLPSGGASVLDVAFSTNSVGWLARQTSGTKGQILRTIDGGRTWVLPSGIYAIGGNDKISALAVCGNANRVWGAGLADNGTDGYLVLAA